jgi:hypothetical protein
VLPFPRVYHQFDIFVPNSFFRVESYFKPCIETLPAINRESGLNQKNCSR